jgi:peptidoglycan/xylan/chitin deacetylase (PgdA/CDA1 family)
LREHHIKAVFCVVGDSVEKHPELVRRIVAEGHGLCNHSSHHDDLGVLDPAKAKADIEATNAALARAVPGETVTWFRAPFGSWGAAAKAGVQLGHTPLGWVVDPEDWKMPGTGVIIERIRKQLTPRAVVLVHDGGGERAQTIAALRTLIPSLRQDGWTFDLPQRRVRTHPLPSPGSSSDASSRPSAGRTSAPSSAPSISASVRPQKPYASPSGDHVVESAPPG